MNKVPDTYIIRHKRENLKKCSLRGLEGKNGFAFFSYPGCVDASFAGLENYVVLDIDGAPLTAQDKDKGLILIDATWRLAAKMQKVLTCFEALPKRSIPSGFKTAYPRRQDDCKDKEAGLASLEALFIAYRVLGRECEGMLDGYYWKEQFLAKNEDLFKKLV